MILVLLLSCTACGSSAEDDGTITIGFIPMTLNNEYFITMCNAAELEAEALGVEIIIQAGDEHSSSDAQLTIVENLIASGVDAICIVPSSSEGLYSAIIKCEEAGIPIINIDTPIEDSVQEAAGIDLPFYGTNNYAGAVLAGEYVQENYASDVQIAVLTGIEGQQNKYDRLDGFIEGLDGNGVIVAEQSASWEVDLAYTATQNILTANPDVELIYCENDSMAVGAVRAIAEAGKTGEIDVIGFDGISEAMNLIESGDIWLHLYLNSLAKWVFWACKMQLKQQTAKLQTKILIQALNLSLSTT